MSVLVLGASGATGRFVVKRLLNGEEKIKIIVRSLEKIKSLFEHNHNLEIIEGSILELPETTLKRLIDDCNTIVVCLGHTNNLKGIYGKPRLLVHDTLERIGHIIDQKSTKERTIKMILMNTSGYSNSKNNEILVGKEKFLVSMLNLLLPPFVDNIKAANYLRDKIGQHHPSIDWVVVRPDTLIDSNTISDYHLETKPTRSPFFDPGKVSRINVADFIYTLITNEAVWITWKNKMPVIYNLD